ncbi:choloylglycine hydrolase family protein [Mesorhizobium sp. BR1-1-16]|uniref:choloylglycine hydrolase family protein n=1 Tax=Mesorhizobium sp. BR1-1-16 TaxID=2876653 RepID=UPI001CCA78E5|nr:choloylglycine hydrolase family protein [Mesorhizobium sp. BR1-1-16]MBZ9937130.1 choloylglycine hydrolase family protein [Mesorhizobium sp. BR1-1-16]
MLRTLAATLSLAIMTHAALACTAVDITAADKSVVSGRTMEWAFDMKWTLESVPKGTTFTLPAPKGMAEKTVTTTYALAGISANIIPGGAILEGQNEAGLGMSGNFLPGFTTYQEVTPADQNYVEILSFGKWALGSFKDVASVKAALEKTKVWTDPALPTGPTPPYIHFIFTDRSGAGIVVEYVDGEVQIHDNAAHVLTNAPTYDWHLTNLRNYVNLSSVGVSNRQFGTANVTAIGQGGGTTGLPGDFTPPSRFVRAAFMRHSVPEPKDAGEAVQTITHVLNTVDIPIGVAESKDGDQVVSDYTQWVSIKDLTNNKLTISDYAHRTSYLTIDLAPIFASSQPMSKLVTALPYPAATVGVEALAP